MQQPEQPIRVMLIDDHPTMLWGLTKLVDGESPRMKVVGTAGNCEEAVAQADRLRPDIIVLDLDLDGRSALDVLPVLLSNSVSRVLILTGEHQLKTLETALLRGARGVLRKDAPAEHVLIAIQRIHRGELFAEGDMTGRVLTELVDSKKAPRRDLEAEKIATLTAKERKIIQALVEGSGAVNKTLAPELSITEQTLRNHLTSIFHKLDLANRFELYVYAVKHQLGDPSANACEKSLSRRAA